MIPGRGKSTVAFGIVNFLGRNGKIVGGRILFQGQDLVSRSQTELRNLRGDRIAMVYQDPMQALNPSMRLGDQMAEVLIVHRGMNKAEAMDRCLHMLERVHMPDAGNVLRRFRCAGGLRGTTRPHEFDARSLRRGKPEPPTRTTTSAGLVHAAPVAVGLERLFGAPVRREGRYFWA